MAATFGDHDTLGYVGAAAYLLGGPVVHLRYGEWTDAGASLGLRLAAPAALGYLGCTVFGDRHGQGRRDGHAGDPDDACLLGGLAGLALGVVGAEVVDWTVLSRVDDGAAPAARMVSLGGRF